MQPKQTYTCLQDFVTSTRKLLTQQQEAQRAAFLELTSSRSIAEIEDEGVGLSNMTVIGSKEGFYDKLIITLCKSYHSDKNRVPIPQNCKLGTGDDVAIYSGDKMVAQGVIYRRNAQKIRITLNNDTEDDQDFDDMRVNIVMKWNQVTYRRYFQVLQYLQSPYSDIHLSHLFFSPTASTYRPKKPQTLFTSPKLNQKQCEAITQGLTQQCHLIHGPPGTGKTTTVCELIVEAVKRGEKVLACAPSNIAVDNIVEGISGRVNSVRVGNPARVISEVLERCLDYIVGQREGMWRDEERKLNAAKKKLKRCKSKAERKQIYEELKVLRTQLKNLQQQVIEQIIKDAEVICCTNVGAADKVFKRYLNKRKFDLVVIDQCGQGLQISCWMPICKAKRIVLAGDHKQLPPTVKFQAQSLLSYTLFSRCMQQLTYLTSTMLQVQYRMNRDIMGWSNQLFYGNRLQAHSSVENHRLKQIYGEVDEQQSVLLFVDTAGCGVGEQGGQMESKFNIGEADIVVHMYRKLLGYGVGNKDIAILTPYSKQVSFIKNLISEQQVPVPQVSTVDGIQGREKQCIIISMVRSNPDGEIGFLKDWRRMNVAVTRARRMLVLVGDGDCVGGDPSIGALLGWIGEHGVVRSAEELRGEEGIRFGLGRVDERKGEKGKGKEKAEKGEKTQKGEKKKKKNKDNKDNETAGQQKNKAQEKKQTKKQHTIEQQQDLKQIYRKLLLNLTEQTILHNLNAYQRKMLHQVAEQYSCQHVTSEDKSKITLRPAVKIEVIEESAAKVNKKKNSKKTQTKEGKSKSFVPKNINELIGMQGPQSEQEQQAKKQEKQQVVQVEQQVVQEQKKPKKKKKKNTQKQQPQQQQDWQKIMDQFQAQMPKADACFKCKKKITSVTAAQCQFCSFYFCRHDLLAEEHGCEDAAREYARKDRGMDKFLGLGAMKIKQKLKQQQDQRRKKPKEKNQKDNKKK